jgi:hypothetical protein
VVPYTVTKRVRSIEAPTERVATPPPKPEVGPLPSPSPSPAPLPLRALYYSVSP